MDADLTPWLALAGLGAFHGINPAMGWLFAVALALHRQSRAVLWTAMVPLALGHAVSVASVVILVVALGTILPMRGIEIAAGVGLIAWAIYHAIYGHRGRVRFGMTVGMLGLGVWSFLMATSHGAGLMLIPVVMPLCLAATPAKELTAAGALPISLAAVGVHMAAMLAVTAAVAALVYEWAGLSFLRRGWINLDLIWASALIVSGIVLLL